MHPALQSWREELSGALVRMFAYLGAAAVLSMAAMQLFQTSPGLGTPKTAPRDAWITIGKPFPAFTLSIPEAADAPAHYAIRRHVDGGGREDVLSLGTPDGADPHLEVRIYRPGSEISRFTSASAVIGESTAALGPVNTQGHVPLMTKFGPMAIIAFDSSRGTPRHCLGFVRQFDEPRLQISGRFCRGGDFIERSTLACALDRLTLLSAGSSPKVATLFAHAELKREFCVQHDPILTPTPKYRLLWKALPDRPMPRRLGR